MKKFIRANDKDDYSAVYVNPDYIIQLGKGHPRIRYLDESSCLDKTEITPVIIPSYWIKVDDGGRSVQYYIDEDTYNNLVNMER